MADIENQSNVPNAQLADRHLSKKERRQMNREMRASERVRHAESGRKKKIITWASLAIIAAGVIFGVVAYARRQAVSLPGEFVSNTLGRDHIAVGASHEAYKTNPPTAGPHYASPVKANIYDEPVADEYLVHNMEHGHVIIWYNCKTDGGADVHSGCADTIERLKAMLKDDYDMWKVVLMPRENLDTRFALTAWERIEKFNDFDENRVRTFIDAYRNKGPEATPE